MAIEKNSAAKTIQKFLKDRGCDAKLSEVLELVAQVRGFTSYRAEKASSAAAVSDTKKTNDPAAPATRGTMIETPDSVVFRATAVDWQLADDPDISLEDLPVSQRDRYDVVMEHFGDQFRILVKPEGIDCSNFEGKPVLDILLEINGGVPCVHLTNDPFDAQLVSIFANEKGLVVRPDDGEWLRADSSDVPQSLRDAAIKACDIREIKKSYVAVMDTAEKYAEA